MDILLDMERDVWIVNTAKESKTFYRKVEIRLSLETKQLMKSLMQRKNNAREEDSEDETRPSQNKRRFGVSIENLTSCKPSVSRETKESDWLTSEDEDEDEPQATIQKNLESLDISNEDHRLLTLRPRCSYTSTPPQTSKRPVNRANLALESLPTEWMVSRIMSVSSNWYLVYWDDWNFTHCTWETKDSLEHSTDLVRDFEMYQKGREAILNNVVTSSWFRGGEVDVVEENETKKIKRKKPNLQLRDVPYVHDQLSNEELAVKMADKAFRIRIGLWKLKIIELEWLKVLDPQGTGIRPPLYLEHMHVGSRVHNLPSTFKFVLDYNVTYNAHDKLMQEEEKPHHCVLEPKETRCKDCEWKNMTQLAITSPSSLNFNDFDGNLTYYIVCCTEAGCVCSGGWRECSQKIPKYPRKMPLAIFYDPRYEWGVRALTNIPKGTIICEYVGRLITNEEGDAYETTTYQMSYDSDFIVDATHEGNESRFLGHCCDPNCVVVRIYENSMDMSKCHRGVMMAIRDIVIGEDLTFDYHPSDRSRPPKHWGKCRCGASNCRGWL